MEDTGDLVFSLRGVSKRRPGQEGFHLRLAAFDAPRGSLLALTGPSGCGKSTALDLLACILRPDIPAADAERDKIRFSFSPTPERREDVLAAWRRGGTDALAALRLRHLGYVLQTGGLLPFLSARENILLHCRSLGIVRQRGEAVDAIVERLGIRHLLGQYPGTLSVGERQRVAIARALAHGPGVVLADEPTAALDPWHARNALHLFTDLTRELGITMIMVTHAPDMAADVGFTLVRFAVESGPDGVVADVRHKAGRG
ncbi:ABC transporter ATP-binding protein [uncultured Desulfovibrio sp.]|uniref:ABC transporter ATP-binding protein n=1 Tax=uncultured Desulfovibrio sp. TaxID=167968 RepID=UPI0026DAC703|nr:ATP-binding cassette domain-containing protein [uncultured Desulfovibrio sp.]